MALNIENTSGAPLAINDLGIELAIGEIVDLSLSNDAHNIASSATGGDLDSLVTAPSIVVKDPIDGVTNLSVADGLAALRAHNETHWRVGAGARIGDISDVDVSGASPGDVLQLGGGGTWDDVPASSILNGIFCDDDSDTCVKVEESADEDIIRFDVGDAPAGYSAVTDIMTIAASGMTVAMGTADAATAGAPISITSGVGGDAASDGGDITITAGDGGATSGTGGNITLAPGDGDTDGVVRIPNKGATNAIILDFDTDGTSSPELRQESGGGAWHLSSDASVVQLFGGSDAAGTTDFFIDADNNANLNLNVLHSGPVVIGEGGLQIEASAGGANEHAIIASPTITADFTWTLPDGNPGGTSFLNITSGGVIGYAQAATEGWTSIQGDTGTATALSTGETLNIQGSATSGTTTVATAGSPDNLIVSLDISRMTAGVTLALTDEFAVDQGASPNVNFTMQDIVDLADANNDKWDTFTADSGSTTANSPTDTLTIAGGTGITTAIAGDTLTITASASSQNVFETITPDSGGNIVADSATDTLTLAGGTNIATVGTPGTDTITINWSGSIDDLSDVDTTTTPPTTDNILKWDGSNWVPTMINELLSGALPAVQVRRTSTLAIGTAYADVTWNATDFENDPTVIEHNNTNTDDIDIFEDGLYLIAFNLSIDANAAVATMDVHIRVNDTTVLPGSLRTISEDDEINDVSNLFVASLTANDKITMQIRSSDTGDVLAATSTMTVIKQQGAKGDQGDPGAGSTVIIEDEGVVVGGGPHDTLNFVGSGVTATDAGGGEATITISGGGDVSSSANITDNAIVRGDGGAKGIQESTWTIADDGLMSNTSISRVGYAIEVFNTLGTGGGNGLHIRGGEVLGDLALRIGDADDTFTLMEVEADQGYVSFGETYAQTLINNGVVYGLDVQHGSSPEADINTQSGIYRVAGTPVTVGENVIQKFVFNAHSLDTPVNADWAVNALAPAAADSNNAGLAVRLFDDTTEEGVGFMLNIPTGAVSMTIRFKSRRETAGVTQTVIPNLYRRTIADNGAVAAWSAALALTALSFPNNEFFQYDEQTITLATLGLTAGTTVQFELTRDGTGTLTGDWALLQVEVEFSPE